MIAQKAHIIYVLANTAMLIPVFVFSKHRCIIERCIIVMCIIDSCMGHIAWVYHRYMHQADHSSKDLYSSSAILKSTHFESHPAKHTFIVSNFYQNSLGSSKLNCQPLFTLSAGQFLLTAPKTLLSALTLIPYDILNIFTSSPNHRFQTFRTYVHL